jgi:hypothetical protein
MAHTNPYYGPVQSPIAMSQPPTQTQESPHRIRSRSVEQRDQAALLALHRAAQNRHEVLEDEVVRTHQRGYRERRRDAHPDQAQHPRTDAAATARKDKKHNVRFTSSTRDDSASDLATTKNVTRDSAKAQTTPSTPQKSRGLKEQWHSWTSQFRGMPSNPVADQAQCQSSAPYAIPAAQDHGPCQWAAQHQGASEHNPRHARRRRHSRGRTSDSVQAQPMLQPPYQRQTFHPAVYNTKPEGTAIPSYDFGEGLAPRSGLPQYQPTVAPVQNGITVHRYQPQTTHAQHSNSIGGLAFQNQATPYGQFSPRFHYFYNYDPSTNTTSAALPVPAPTSSSGPTAYSSQSFQSHAPAQASVQGLKSPASPKCGSVKIAPLAGCAEHDGGPRTWTVTSVTCKADTKKGTGGNAIPATTRQAYGPRWDEGQQAVVWELR